jgi:hypothetical protein
MTTQLTATGSHLAHTWRSPLGRAGLVAKGALYIVLGLLAIQFANGDTSSQEVNQAGAFETVIEQPFGKFLMFLMTAGLIALVCWHVIQAIYGDPVEGDERSDRAKYAAKAVLYGAMTVLAVGVLVNESASTSGNQTEREATKTIFDWPGGRFIVGLIGLVLVGIALYQVVKYVVNKEYMDRISPPAGTERAFEVTGRLGYAARAVVIGMSGIFFVVAAVQYDAKESRGIAGSLQELAQNDFGRIVLWLVAIGLFAFGVFTLAEARYRTAA